MIFAKDCDVSKIEKLLEGIPPDMEIERITFDGDDYVLHFKKSLSLVKDTENDKVMLEVLSLIKYLDGNQA